MKRNSKMDDYTKSFGLVKVKFENPKYNYETNVSGDVTEEEAKKYFIGKMFDVGVYPKENMQKSIGIEFFPKGTYSQEMAKGGGFSSFMSNVKSLRKTGLSKTKEAYGKTKEYVKGKVHDQKKKIALDVIYDAKENLPIKREEINALDKAFRVVEDKYAKGGGVEKNYEVELFFKGLSEEREVGKYVISEKSLERLEEEYGHIFSIDVIDETSRKAMTYYDLKKEIWQKGRDRGFYANGGGVGDDYISNELYDKLDKITDWKIVRQKEHRKNRNVVLVLSKSGKWYKISVVSNGKEMPKMSTYYTTKQSAENSFNGTITKFQLKQGGGVGEITPELNELVTKRAQEIYSKEKGKTKADFDKFFDKAIREFGYEPKLYHKIMSEIGGEYEEYSKGGGVGSSFEYTIGGL